MISTSELYAPVNNLTSMGIITEQKKYNPKTYITRAQFAAMINRTYLFINHAE